MIGDYYLSSTAALIFWQFVAKFAGNFAMKRRRGGREFKSNADNSAVFKISAISENRSKSARVRAICDRAWTQRARSLRGTWPKSANFSLGAICLGPRIIALDSPAISERQIRRSTSTGAAT
jgi:hypothetical protein